ncbi:hypothetical protein K3X48_11130 [Aliiroseovarius crassostreae]|uniref:RiboL-PSP-HEPN domain-containing protein n=1 Tax=Aliiroseovarius crassostreae TaxID=154981 RepID=A0A9Q9LYS2_9RHOB|nr:HEPN domain-containing protein [Aliiroseovarius crassostreae]UWP94758.1 hypothetical protein K3X48_11130 [Aliiroseovarius crassostreae]
MLVKTRHIASLVEEVIERAAENYPADRAFLEAAFSGYLSAMAYAEIERNVEKILSERFGAINDEKVAHFISETYGKKQGRIQKSDIANLAKQFGENCKSQFNDSVEGRSATFYTNLLQCRHNLAHGEPENETLLTAKNGINAAEVLLTALKNSIQR